MVADGCRYVSEFCVGRAVAIGSTLLLVAVGNARTRIHGHVGGGVAVADLRPLTTLSPPLYVHFRLICFCDLFLPRLSYMMGGATPCGCAHLISKLNKHINKSKGNNYNNKYNTNIMWSSNPCTHSMHMYECASILEILSSFS